MPYIWIDFLIEDISDCPQKEVLPDLAHFWGQFCTQQHTLSLLALLCDLINGLCECIYKTYEIALLLIVYSYVVCVVSIHALIFITMVHVCPPVISQTVSSIEWSSPRASSSHRHWRYVINSAFSNDLWSVAAERRIRVCLDSSRQTCWTDSWLWGHVWSHLCVHEKVDLCSLYYIEYGNERDWV